MFFTRMTSYCVTMVTAKPLRPAFQQREISVFNSSCHEWVGQRSADWCPRPTCSGRPSHSMDVVLVGGWDIGVDHHVHCRDVKSPASELADN